jgi:hypothetical protein
VHKAESIADVALPGGIRADDYRERPEFKLSFLEALESLELQSLQHGTF